jgi:hypothetical protein
LFWAVTFAGAEPESEDDDDDVASVGADNGELELVGRLAVSAARSSLVGDVAVQLPGSITGSTPLWR